MATLVMLVLAGIDYYREGNTDLKAIKDDLKVIGFVACIEAVDMFLIYLLIK